MNTQAWLDRQKEKRELAEIRVLGTALSHPHLVDEVVSKVEPAMFRRDAHRILAEAIWSLVRDGKRVDMETVTDRVLGAGRLDEVGGPVAIYDVYVCGEEDTRSCDELLALERRRQVWQACNAGAVAATNPDTEPDDVAAQVVANLSHVERGGESHGLMSSRDILALDVPDWIVDGIIPSGFTLLFGSPKSGKSHIALRTAWSYSTGTRWFRRRCRGTPGKVLYLAGEGIVDAKLRMQALAQATGVFPEDDNLSWYTGPLSLARSSDAAKLRLMVERFGAGLVIVDTWQRYAGVRSENDAAEVSQAVAALEALPHLGASVLLVHHTNTSGGIRGSTVLEGAVEASIKVARKYDSVTEQPLNDTTVTSHRVRRGAGFAPIPLKWFEVGPDAVLEEPWWKPPQPQQTLV